MPYEVVNRGTRRKSTQVDQARQAEVGIITDQPRVRTLDGDATNWLETLWNTDVTNGRVLRIKKPDGSIGLFYDATGLNISGDLTVSGAISHAGGPVFNLQAFGGDESGASDTLVALAAAEAAMPATGGVLYVPTGTYKTTATYTFAKPVSVIGDGPGVSVFKNYATATDVFRWSTQTGVVLRDFGISTNAARTAGAGIAFTPGAGNNNQRSSMVRVGTNGMFNGFDMTDCAYYTVLDCNIEGCVNDGIIVHNTLNADVGDSKIIGCLFTISRYGILQKSGGGLRVIGNKCLSGTIAYYYKAASGGSTGGLELVGNNFENQSSANIAFDSDGGGAAFGAVQIVGNRTASAPNAITIPTTGNWIKGVTITGNMFGTTSGGNCVNLVGGDSIEISGNEAIDGTLATFVAAGAGATNVHVGLNHATGFANYATGASPSLFVVGHEQRGNAGDTTNSAFFGGFKTPSVTITFAHPYLAAPKCTVTPLGATAISAQIVSRSTTQLVYTILGTTTATALTADWSASGDLA